MEILGAASKLPFLKRRIFDLEKEHAIAFLSSVGPFDEQAQRFLSEREVERALGRGHRVSWRPFPGVNLEAARREVGEAESKLNAAREELARLLNSLEVHENET